jgi:hypothetical protein
MKGYFVLKNDTFIVVTAEGRQLHLGRCDQLVA